MIEKNEETVLFELRANPIPYSGRLGKSIPYGLFVCFLSLFIYGVFKNPEVFVILPINFLIVVAFILMNLAGFYLLPVMDEIMLSPIFLQTNGVRHPISLYGKILRKRRFTFIDMDTIEKICWRVSRWHGYFGKAWPKEFVIYTKEGKKYKSFQRHPDDVDKFIEIIKERWPHIQIEELKKR